MTKGHYRVTADIEYLDGFLAGMVIPAGYSVSVPDLAHAINVSTWIAKVRKENDFVRSVTGNRYQFRSNPSHYRI